MEIFRDQNVASFAVVPLIDRANRPDYKAAPTLAAGDVKVSRYTSGAYSTGNIGTLPGGITGITTQVLVTLTATELNPDDNKYPVIVTFIDQTSPKEWDDQTLVIWTRPATANLTQWKGTAPNDLVSSRVDASVGAIASGAITATSIATDAITADKIAASAITSSELADGAITAAKFGASAITATVLANDAITADKIAANAITSSELADGTLTAAKFGASAITSTVLADNAITDAKLATGAITAAKFGASAITSTVLANDAITADKIAANAITAAKIATDAITSDELAASALSEIGDAAAAAILVTPANKIAVSAGNITSADVKAINTSTLAASNLSVSAETMITATVDDSTFTPTTTSFETDLTEETASHYVGRVVIFTSGALIRQVGLISAYEYTNSKGKITVKDALTEAPLDDDTLIII